MRKFTAIASVLCIAGLALNANAQEGGGVYISGAFNGYAPDGNSEWALVQDEDDENIYRGYFEIPEGQFKFNFQYGFSYFVPGIVDDYEIVPSDENQEVLVGDSFFAGPIAYATSNSNLFWINENWSGGFLEVIIDGENEELILSAEAEIPEYWYIRGAFNDYDPAGSALWALMDDDEGENGVYTGTFTVPAGKFSFNLMNPYGFVFIPYDIDNVEITFEDNKYFGYADMAWDEYEEMFCWTYPSWEGGNITVTIDSNTGGIEIYAMPDSPVGGEGYVINGPIDDIITVMWSDVDDVSALGAYNENAYIITSDGENIDLLYAFAGIGGDVSLYSEGTSYGIKIDLSRLNLMDGTYTLVIPAEYLEIVSDDWETWEKSEEIRYEFTYGSSTGVSGIENDGIYRVYNLQGVQVMEGADLNNLENGIYIVNGKKIVVRK